MKFVHTSGNSGSDDGLWMSLNYNGDLLEVAVYEVSYWEDMDSSAVKTHGKYNVQSGTVCLVPRDLSSALRFYGWHITEEGIVSDSGDIVAAPGTDTYKYALAECLWRYGSKDVACDVSGNNLRKLVKQAKNAL